MAEFKIPPIEPNSYKHRADKQQEEQTQKSSTPAKLTPVLSKNDLVRPKENFGTKLRDLFFSKTPSNLGEIILRDCIAPSVMKILWDTIQISLFGKADHGNYYNDSRYRDYSRSYPSPHRNNDYTRSPYRNTPATPTGVDYRNLILTCPEDAERIVHIMWDRIRKDRQVSIAQLLELFDVVGEITDNNWGWTDERDIGIRKVPNGFLIDLAEPKYLN